MKRLTRQLASAAALCVALLLLGLFSGCAAGKKSALQPQAGPEAVEAAAPAAAAPQTSEAARPGFEPLALPDFNKPRPEKPLPKEEPIDPLKLALEDKPVTVNVEGMPLSDFIVHAIGNTLKVTFFMDEAVRSLKTPVTLKMAQELPAARALEIALDILRQHNLMVEQRSGALYILQAKPAPRQPLDIRLGRDATESPANILQIVRLNHLQAGDIASLLSDIYKNNVTVKIYYKENSLMLSGSASAIKEMLGFIEIMDVPYLTGKKPFLTQLTYWQPEEFIKQMTTILQGLGFSISAAYSLPGITFIPIKYLNSLLVVAPDEATLKVIMDWKNRLDTAESAGAEEKAFTFSPRYSRASELVDSIKKLYGILPAQQQAKGAAPQTQAATQAPLTFTGFKMSADDRKNVVLIMAAPSAYKAILPLIKELDTEPKQVLIEATIAELTLKDDLQYGLEWYMKSRMEKGDYALSTLDKLGLGTATGLAYQFVSDSQRFQATINAFAKENKVNILSSPRLMVLDNEEASLQIGTEVPIITGETKSTLDTTQSTVTTQSVQYRSTGLQLRVKPTINTDGLLILNISLESSEAQTNTSSKIDSPMIFTRKLTTMVVASSAQSILLGGIMSENISATMSKVPLLGDLPLIGNAFKSTSKGKTKTELIVILTPTILTSADSAVKLTNEIKQGLKWLK